MWLAIVGYRNFNDYDKFCKMINYIQLKFPEKMEKVVGIVSGEAPGVDQLAKRWAAEKNLLYEGFPADWSLGKRAGPIRNRKIVDKMDFMIALPKVEPDGSYSKGTKNSIELAKKSKKVCYIIEIQ